MKNIGQYNQDLSVPRKKDIDSLEARVKTNEDNIAMAESDIEGLTTDVGTLKTDVGQVKTALNSKQDTITGGASTITDNNLTANHALVSNGSGKVEASTVTSTELGYLDGATSNIQTQLNKKIEKVHDNDISWGGKNLSGEVSPTDAAMVSVIGGNKFALCKPQGITIEYTNDAGTTWKNYDTTDEIKINVISGISKTRLYYGKKTESSQIVTADDMLRITVNAFTCGVYTFVKKILIEFATGGSIDDSVKIESATIGDQEAFTVVGTYAVKGNSGWNSIPYSKNFGAYTLNQTSNVGVLRFTFSTKTAKGNPSVQNLILNGITNYVNPNKLSATGHLYSYDYQQNAIFPAKLTATSFEGDGSALTNISYPVTSVNTKTGAVVLTKSDIGLSNVDNVKQYSASNPPPYPVSSVNGQTGAVTLGASDIGALPLAGGTLTGPLVLGNEDAQIKIGEAGVIFNPSHDEPQIVISDSHYATQYISLSSSQTKIVGGTQFTNTNMTLAPNGITIQKLESGVPSTATLSGISDGVNDHDAVNLSQLNAVKSKIPSNIYNPNLLANWDLSNTINTTGITSWSLSGGSSMPVFNGYFLGGTPSDKPTVEIVSSYFVKLTNTVSSESRLWNKTSNVIIGPNKTYTFSVLVEPYGFTPNENTYIYVEGQVTSPEIKSSNYDNGLYMLTFATGYNIIPVTDSVGIALGSAGFMYIKGMKLEEGTNQTLCHKNSSGDWVVTDSFNPQIELAKISQWKKDVEYGVDVWKYIGSPLLPLSGGTMTGSINMGNQKITNMADGTKDTDVATVKQVKAGGPKGPVMVMISNVTLGAAKEVIHNNLWDCTFLGTITGTSYIDGVAVQVYPQSYIVSVGGSDYADGGGYCAIQKSMNSMSVVIKMLCSSSTAPRSIQIPCLVW